MSSFRQVMQSLPKKEMLNNLPRDEIVSVLHRLITANPDTMEQKFIIFNVIKSILIETDIAMAFDEQNELDQFNDLLIHIFAEYLRYLKEIPQLRTMYDTMLIACSIDTFHIMLSNGFFFTRKDGEPPTYIEGGLKTDDRGKIVEFRRYTLDKILNRFPQDGDCRMRAQILANASSLLSLYEYGGNKRLYTSNTLAASEFTPQERQRLIHAILNVTSQMRRTCPQYVNLYLQIEKELRQSGQVRM